MATFGNFSQLPARSYPLNSRPVYSVLSSATAVAPSPGNELEDAETINGLPIAQVGSINGVPIADIGQLNGVS
jgi:hypothetical protein